MDATDGLFVDCHFESILKVVNSSEGVLFRFQSEEDSSECFIRSEDAKTIGVFIYDDFGEGPELENEFICSHSPEHSIYFRKTKDDEIEILKQFIGNVTNTVVIHSDDRKRLNHYLMNA